MDRIRSASCSSCRSCPRAKPSLGNRPCPRPFCHARAIPDWHQVSEQVRIVRIWLLTALVAVCTPAASARGDEGQEHQGLQAGWAVDDKGNVNFTSSYTPQNRTMHEAEASWARLNFRLGAC